MKNNTIVEFGDFQTPKELCRKVGHIIQQLGFQPKSIVEPTCGVGNFIKVFYDLFNDAEFVGLDINIQYIEQLTDFIGHLNHKQRIRLTHADFFQVEWDGLLASLPEPILLVGNPPWVTNTELSNINGVNLPKKNNFKQLNGLDAITGKSNFDISEWMLIRLVDLLLHKNAMLAFLCKTAVARKVLTYFWKRGVSFTEARFYLFDSKKYFDVSVDTCLFILNTQKQSPPLHPSCSVFNSMESSAPAGSFGYLDDNIISNVTDYNALRYLKSKRAATFQWRSGVKHDCAKVMELKRIGEHNYLNGLGEQVVLEDDYLFPMLKSSDVGNKVLNPPKRYMLVTQRNVGDAVTSIQQTSPKTWEYLQNHKQYLDARRSIIYKKNPQFSIFGVGDYTFAFWKVAISGFYKSTHFKVIPPYEGKPVVLDDTIYFLPCHSKEEAERLANSLNSEPAQRFLNALIFMDAKRPITIEILKKLNIEALEVQPEVALLIK